MDLKPKLLKPGMVVSARYIDLKLDGWTLEIESGSSGLVCAYTRTCDRSKWLSEVPWYRELMLRLPPQTRIAGELYAPGKPASEVARMLADWEGRKSLQFAAFALLSFNGLDTRFVFRNDNLERLTSLGVKSVPYIFWDKTITSDEAANLYLDLRSKTWPPNIYATVTPADIEGLVIKEDHYRGWYKWKASSTVDLVVTSISPGQGKYSGQAGALVGSVWATSTSCKTCPPIELCRVFSAEGATCPICFAPLSLELVEVANVSGMDDTTRANISESDIGRVFECEYQYVGAGGRLRHPRFKRWRDDKPAKECFLTD